jgi:hypothetical protein
MSTSRKSICSNDDEGENVRRADSSYAKMKIKMKSCEHDMVELRMELLETQRQKVEVEAALERVIHFKECAWSSKEGQSSYAKLKMKMKSNHVELVHVQEVLQETHRIKVVLEADLVTVRMDLNKVRMELQGAQMKEIEHEAELHSLCTELYEEVMNGAHKAQTKVALEKMTEVIRRLGDLSSNWGHKFDEKNTKVLQNFKLPYDQSRKIFAMHQLSGLRDAVYIAVPASDVKKTCGVDDVPLSLRSC